MRHNQQYRALHHRGESLLSWCLALCVGSLLLHSVLGIWLRWITDWHVHRARMQLVYRQKLLRRTLDSIWYPEALRVCRGTWPLSRVGLAVQLKDHAWLVPRLVEAQAHALGRASVPPSLFTDCRFVWTESRQADETASGRIIHAFAIKWDTYALRAVDGTRPGQYNWFYRPEGGQWEEWIPGIVRLSQETWSDTMRILAVEQCAGSYCQDWFYHAPV